MSTVRLAGNTGFITKTGPGILPTLKGGDCYGTEPPTGRFGTFPALNGEVCRAPDQGISGPSGLLNQLYLSAGGYNRSSAGRGTDPCRRQMRFILLAGQQEPTSDNLSEFGQKSGGCRVFRGVRDIEPVSWSRHGDIEQSPFLILWGAL